MSFERSFKNTNKKEQKAPMQLKTRGFGKMPKNQTMPIVWQESKTSEKGVQSERKGGLLYVSKASSPLKLPKKLTYRKLKIIIQNSILLL